jgi:DNA-binding GntR family transcriptional regulator
VRSSRRVPCWSREWQRSLRTPRSPPIFRCCGREKEHEALRTGQTGDAISLSARFHVAIAEIAAHSILTEFVTDLVSRSSLIVALYWHRRDTTCEVHAHRALVNAIAQGKIERCIQTHVQPFSRSSVGT